MRSLIELLQSSTLNKVVKPHVITAFADIAMAIGGEFDRYTAIILLMLNQAGSVQIDTDDEDLIDYINSLHVSILEAYTGIIQSLRECRKQDSVFPQIEAIFNFINRIGSNENKSTEVLKCVVGLIGDIGQTYGKRARQYLQNAVVMKLLQEGNAEEDIHEIAVWAHSVCRFYLIYFVIFSKGP
jgi:importin subunit beta-1